MKLIKLLPHNYRTSWIKLTVTLGFILCTASYAQKVNPLLACLGKEELILHRSKTTGPAYYLNQLFINELATINGIKLVDQKVKLICKPGAFSPSVKLLRLLLLEGKSAFYISPNVDRGGVEALATSSLEGFLQTIPHVFFSYLAKLQALAPSANCLKEEIPEISYYINQFRYLEGEMSTKSLIADKAKLNRIFRKLYRFESILKRCQVKADKKEESYKKKI